MQGMCKGENGITVFHSEDVRSEAVRGCRRSGPLRWIDHATGNRPSSLLTCAEERQIGWTSHRRNGRSSRTSGMGATGTV